MATYFKRTQSSLGTVSTSRYVMITTAAAQQIFLGTGNSALSVFNHGSGNLIWGDANIQVNSGNYIYVNARTEWENLQDGWSVYFRADSVQALITIAEYRV